MKTVILFFLSLCPCSNLFAQQAQNSNVSNRPAVLSKPVALNWKTLDWPHTVFQSSTNAQGTTFYKFFNSQEKRFKIDIVFNNTSFSINQAQRVAFGAMVDNVLLGGGKTFPYEDVQSLMNKLGLSVVTNLTSRGQFKYTVSGLAEDIKTALKITEDVLVFPQFRESGLKFWHQYKQQDFTNLLDANTSREQSDFIQQEISKLAHGEEHFYSKFLERASPKNTAAVSVSQMQDIAKTTLVQAGATVFVSGKFDDKSFSEIQSIVGKLKKGSLSAYEWLPGRLKNYPPNGKVGVMFIQKNDMSQSNVNFRCYAPSGGKLNKLEEAQMRILSDVFSAQGGVVGNDRFSKAMRADSGISYSASARFNSYYLWPNTNVPLFSMSFQTSGARTVEALQTAYKTWDNFIKNGVSQEEFDNAKVSLMNRELATENTVFDKSEEILENLLSGETLTTQPVLESLVNLDKQKNALEANETLKNLTSKQMACFMVLFGNTPSSAVELLKKGQVNGFTHLKTIEFNQLTQQFLK
jgi:zinc protease